MVSGCKLISQSDNKHNGHSIFDTSPKISFHQNNQDTEQNLSFLNYHSEKNTKNSRSNKTYDHFDNSSPPSNRQFSTITSNDQKSQKSFNLLSSISPSVLGISTMQSQSQASNLPPNPRRPLRIPQKNQPMNDRSHQETRESHTINSNTASHFIQEKRELFKQKQHSLQEYEIRYTSPFNKSMNKGKVLDDSEKPVSFDAFKTKILEREFIANEILPFNKYRDPVEFLNEDCYYVDILIKTILGSLNSSPLLIFFGVTNEGYVAGTPLTVDEIQNELTPLFARCYPQVNNIQHVIYHEKIIVGLENGRRSMIIIEVVQQHPSMFFFTKKQKDTKDSKDLAYYTNGPNYELTGLSLINQVQGKCKKFVREAEEKMEKNINLIEDLLSKINDVKDKKDLQNYTNYFKDQIIDHFL